MLAAMDKHEGGRPTDSKPIVDGDRFSTLPSMGITLDQSANWQKIAAMTDEQVSSENLCTD